MEFDTGSRESKKKSREDNPRSSENKEKRRKSMEDDTGSTENESEEDILDKGDEEADEEHDQELEVLEQPEPVTRFFVPSTATSQACIPISPYEPFFRKARPRKPREMISSGIPFFRKARLRKPREMINHHVEPGQNIVLVRPKPSRQGNPKAPMEGDEEIIEEKAVCKVCSDILREENIFKTECKCGNALIHEKCVADSSGTGGNNNCDYCEQEVQTFPVTLVRGLSSSTPVVDREESKKCFCCFHG